MIIKERKKMKDNKNIYLLIIGYVTFSIFFIQLASSGSYGYELDIYSSYPYYTWLFQYVSIGCGLLVLWRNVITKSESSSWVYGFILIILNNVGLISIPILKSYFVIGRHDALSHLGSVIDIVETGYVSQNDLWPIMFLSVITLSSLSGISERIIMNIFPIIFYIIYILSIYLISHEIFEDKNTRILCLSSLSTLLFSVHHAMFTPYHLSLSITPFLIFILIKFWKKESRKFTLLGIVCIIYLTYLHALTAYIMLIFIMLLGFTNLIMNIITNYGNNDAIVDIKYFNKSTITIFSLLFISLNGWISKHGFFYHVFSPVFSVLFGRKYYVQNTALWISNTILDSQISFFQLIFTTIKWYGSHAIMLFFSCLGMIFILYNVLRQRKQFVTKDITLLYIWLVTNIALNIVHLFYTYTNFGYDRLIFSTSALIPIYFGYSVTNTLHFLNKTKSKKYFLIVIFSLIFLSAVNTSRSLFPSPYIKAANNQVTFHEINAMSWFYEYKDKAVFPHHIRMTYRFAQAIYGRDYVNQRNDIPLSESPGPKYLIPDHFNYTVKSNLGEVYDSVIYIPISKFDEDFYLGPYYDLDRFSKNDFMKILYDVSVNLLYSNGEVRIFEVLPKS